MHFYAMNQSDAACLQDQNMRTTSWQKVDEINLPWNITAKNKWEKQMICWEENWRYSCGEMIKTHVYVGITPPMASFLFSSSPMHALYFDLIATSPLAMPLSFTEMDYFGWLSLCEWSDWSNLTSTGRASSRLMYSPYRKFHMLTAARIQKGKNCGSVCVMAMVLQSSWWRGWGEDLTVHKVRYIHFCSL